MLHKVRDYAVHSWVMQSVSAHFLCWTWNEWLQQLWGLIFNSADFDSSSTPTHARTPSTLLAAVSALPKTRAGAARFSCMADKRWNNWTPVVLEVLKIPRGAAKHWRLQSALSVPGVS